MSRTMSAGIEIGEGRASGRSGRARRQRVTADHLLDLFRSRRHRAQQRELSVPLLDGQCERARDHEDPDTDGSPG
jgi:hypothetical protein